MRFKLVWFDSYGAKSSCTWVQTDIKIIIDPGVSIMHPSFPCSEELKEKWTLEGYNKILEFAKNSNIIIISHYHWDHFIDDNFEIYRNKIIFAKNSNEWINDSQRDRALEFYKKLFEYFNLEFKLLDPAEKEYKLPKLKSFDKDFGYYNPRRRELLEKGEKWFWNRVENWKKYRRIPEIESDKIKIYWAENREIKIGKTRIRFTEPKFHGIEFSRVGWVFSTIIEYDNEKLIHTSDLNGPIIEDYAEWIIQEGPDYIILDGSPTYLIPYQMNLINLKRVIENVKEIIEEVDFKLLIWDHHLPREKNFRKRTKEVWELAEKLNKKVLTAGEYEFNKKPVVEEI